MMRKLLTTIFAGAVLTTLSASWAFQAGSSERGQARLEREVRHELVMLPYYSVFDHMAFRVDGNTVALVGQVTRPTLKTDAERVVKSIEGVEQVKNEIEVLPPSPEDDRIRLAVFRAIYGDPALNRYAHQAVPPIHIIVKNGHVTLEGVVANEADKNIAGIRANSVPGVFSVKNNLKVESQTGAARRVTGQGENAAVRSSDGR